jgi:hypothetical protein
MGGFQNGFFRCLCRQSDPFSWSTAPPPFAGSRTTRTCSTWRTRHYATLRPTDPLWPAPPCRSWPAPLCRSINHPKMAERMVDQSTIPICTIQTWRSVQPHIRLWITYLNQHQVERCCKTQCCWLICSAYWTAQHLCKKKKTSNLVLELLWTCTGFGLEWACAWNSSNFVAVALRACRCSRGYAMNALRKRSQSKR